MWLYAPETFLASAPEPEASMSDDQRKRQLSRERNRRYRERHPDRVREKARRSVAKWRAENPDQSHADCRAYHEANRDEILSRKREYYQRVRKLKDATSEGRLKDLNRKHRRRSAQQAGTVTAEDWRRILDQHKHRCAYCDRADLPLTQDHVLALSKGGKHCPSNIVPACRPCNSAKGNR